MRREDQWNWRRVELWIGIGLGFILGAITMSLSVGHCDQFTGREYEECIDYVEEEPYEDPQPGGYPLTD